MKRVEGSILSRDYKKHIQVGGSTAGGLCFLNLHRDQGMGIRKGQALFKDRVQTSHSYLHKGLEGTGSPCH